MKIPRTELFLMENDDERINGKRIISDEHSTDIEETSLSLSLCRVAGKFSSEGKWWPGKRTRTTSLFTRVKLLARRGGLQENSITLGTIPKRF